MRLRALTRRACGDERPKQYAALVGARSLLRQTLDRVALAIPSERTVVVTRRSHAGYASVEFPRHLVSKVLVQPEDRGTAAGILFPGHWIRWRDPEATVAVFPSDHFVVEEGLFMRHVAEVAAGVNRHPEWIVLLGARPTDAETGYGWIEPGEPLPWKRCAHVSRVQRFWEKPSFETARACLEAGWLWNTLVLVARAETLIEAGRRCVPALHDRLARIAPFTDTEEEAWAIHQGYALAPSASFSRAVLEAGLPFLAVSKLPPLTWSDWGTPERVLRSLRTIGISPKWLSGVDRPAWGASAG